MNKTALLFVVASSALAQDALEIMTEVQRRSRSSSQHYEGALEVTAENSRVSRKRWVYERIGAHGSSKAVLRFTAPAEVKGMALLILNHPDRASDQWMWTPSINRERRIALQDRSTRFFGTDFTFEDLEERDVSQYDYRLLGEEAIAGAPCWKVESKAKRAKGSQYTHSYVWVRKDNYVIVRVEGYKRDKLIRSIMYSDIERVQNVWTAQRIEVHDPGRNSRTVLTLDRLEYNVRLDDNDFTLQALRRHS
jgi:outer membrane lipoprotein-sorting protein